MERIIDEGIILLDSDLHCLFANAKAKMLFGIDAESQFRDEQGMNLLGPLLKEFQTLNNGFIDKELRVNFPDIGSEKTVRTLSTAIAGDQGKAGYVICVSDVSSDRERERLQSEFLSHVSHEMRTPLTVMKEFSDILMNGLGGQLNSTQKEYLSIIQNNIQSLAKVVTSIIDISRLEAGKVKLSREIANVERLIKRVVYMLGPHAKKKGIKLSYKASERLPATRIDVDKVAQVLINLIENAFKYTPEGGSIKVNAKKHDNSVHVSISDTGIGMQSENRERIFDKFYQIGLKPGPGAKGVGMGLAITKQIVLMHGGEIWVDSTPAKGSSFTFVLPGIARIKDLASYVNECIDFAEIMGRAFSLIRITITNMKELEKGGHKRQVIGKMEKTIQNVLRRATDSDPIIVRDSLFIGLPNTSRRQANILEERLANAFTFRPRVSLRYGLASYPADVKTADEMIKQCLKRE